MRRRVPAGPVRAPASAAVSLGVVTLLATGGSFAAAFGVMTGCTDTHGCTATGCPPCRTTGAWLTGGWIAQGVLLVVGVVLLVLAARGVRPGAVRRGAVLLGALSVAVFATSVWSAVRAS